MSRLIRQNNNDYIGLARNTSLSQLIPTFLIDGRCYILLEKSKILLSFDVNIEHTPLVDGCLQVKIYCCGNIERIDEYYFTNLNDLVAGYSLYRFPELSCSSINLEF